MDQDVAAEVVAVKLHESTLARVADRIKESAPKVSETLEDLLTQREIDSRVSLLDKALGELQSAKNEVKKVKPDQEFFDHEGKVVSSSFSKAKAEELKKAKEKVDSLENAIEKALAGDFQKLKEKVKV